ncbi:MAG: alpha-2-macroglobulin family protein, partial [Candidatus Cryptobacteroides sp.]
MKKYLKLLLILASVLVSCRQDVGMNPDPAFADYIYAYSGGLVNENASIRIKFTGAADTSVPPGDLFSFSPSVRGSARWVSSDMVEFLPDAGALKPGRRYGATFDLSKVYEVRNPELRQFRFSFTVARKKAEIHIDQVYVSKASATEASVRGHVVLSECLPADLMKDLFYAEGNTAGSRFVVEEKGGVWHFVCEGLPRKGSDERLNVVFDAHRAGFDESISASVIIPGTDVFKVLSAKSHSGAEPYVEVVMSSPLDPLADLDGYFSISDGRNCSAVADGNIVKLSYVPGDEDFTLTVDAALKDCQGRRLGTSWSADFRQDELKPAVKLLFEGTVLPDDSNLKLPFKSVNLNAVDVKVVQIYSHNVLSFLQDNDLNGDYQLRRSGRLVFSRKLSLENGSGIDLHRWQNFCIDLSGLMKREKGAIYRVVLSFRQEYSVYGSGAPASTDGTGMTYLAASDVTPEENAVWDIQNAYYYDNSYNWAEYDWYERDNPFHPTYYMVTERFPSANLMTSNLGVLAKSGESGDICVYVNDILTTEPLKGVEVEVYGFQLQRLCSGVTDSDGKVIFHSGGKPFVAVAKTADAISYLKLGDGSANSLSRFDVGGTKAEKGMRGYIYGERGIWRPGDDIHLTLAVKSDTGEKLPDNHPAVLELYDSMGHLHSRTVCTKSTGGLYTFNISTSPDNPTGTWHAYAKLGGASFHKALPVEIIKANRLKIRLDLGCEELKAGQPLDLSLKSSWLTGPAASGLKAKSELMVSRTVSAFRGYENYNFTNPLSGFRNYEKEWFSTVLDKDGEADLKVTVPVADNAPGLLKATVVTRVSEPGGEESVVSTTCPYSPFDAYVGVRAPQDSYLETDRDYEFGICVLDSKGRRVTGHRIRYTFYKLDWKWWWENEPDQLASYISGESAKVYDSGEFVSGGADYPVHFSLPYPDWGRFLLLVRDLDSSHSSGAEFMCDWPLWRGRSNRGGGESASLLSFSLDKETYHPGEDGRVYIPAAKDGRAIVTVENGSRVIFSDIVKTSADRETSYRFKVTEDMSPNCYVAVTLLNPYSVAADGMPLRMYGVKPVTVVDESSRLYPQISLPDELAPQKDFTVRVSEKSGRPMAYTIAIVDEGLLDISNFKTPDPWAAMNRKVALGVKTWDLYNDVAGAYSGSFSSMFKVGGDEDLSGGDRSAKDNRFEPVVLFTGPFQLSGKVAEHRFRLPMYSGRVRVMLVAASENAFGNTEKTVPVRTPLMIAPTLPRRLGLAEKTVMPVNVFVNGGRADKVTLSVRTEGPLALESESEVILDLRPVASATASEQTRDALSCFKLRTADGSGTAKVIVSAKCGTSVVTDTLTLEVKNLMSPLVVCDSREIAPGTSASYELPRGAGAAMVEACTFPSLDVNACRLGMMNTISGHTGQMASSG